jgi:ATP-dependent DNA helicase RecG
MIHRLPAEKSVPLDKGALKVQIKEHDAPINAPITDIQEQLTCFIRSNPAISYDELAALIRRDRSTVMRNIGKLKEAGLLKRVGSKKTGHWELSE